MNKKQLTLQNSSLFAELERKAKEIEILNIRLDEAEQKANALSDENKSLKHALKNADSENKNLFERKKELEIALAEAETKITNYLTVLNTSKPEFESKPLETKFAEKNEEVDEKTTDSTDDAIVKQQNEEKVTEVLTPPATIYEEDLEKSKATADLLRDYGAKIIGKVTRVTAEVISKVNSDSNEASESLKTLALGKNESFKFQIIELAKKKGDPEKVMAEMDLLADEAIIYLRSI